MASLRAKVFISCGQRKDSVEVEVARAITGVLQDLGFEPYIAVEEQTLLGLRENLFSQLATSEYFLFIDFPREQLNNGPSRRGSLFSHQELAIASYLDLELIAFQHKDVKPLDGMLPIIQANAKEFDDATKLPETVVEQVRKSGWRTDWKNTLRITREQGEFHDADIVGETGQAPFVKARFFHLRVENLHKSKPAFNCTAYIEAIRNLGTDSPVDFLSAELKWAGVSLPSVAIMPKSHRLLDAFFVTHRSPRVLQFSCFSDSGRFMTPIQGPGRFQLDFVVLSENFPEARSSTTVTLDTRIDDVTLV